MNNFKRIIKKAKRSNITLIVFSLLLSIIVWAVVKINFSEDATRTLTDIRVSLDSSLAEENSFYPFFEGDEIKVDVQVTGKSYEINSRSFSSSDIVIEASSGFVDSTGYKVINLSPTSNNPDITISSVSPSSINVFYDRKESRTVDVEAFVTNEGDIVEKGYTLGKPVPSLSTVEVEGPATVVSALNKVIFSAEVSKDKLPLKETTELPAKVEYDMESSRGSVFLTIKSLQADKVEATVTVPVSSVRTVPVSVSFLNQPAYYADNPLNVSISPESVDVSFSSTSDDVDRIIIGAVDFRQLKNEKNAFTIDAETSGTYTILSDVSSFEVTVDLSDMSSKTLDESPSNIVFTGQETGEKYSVAENSKNLKDIVIIGPKESLEKIKADDLQVEINVSELEGNGTKRCKVSNIAITTADDCWVYGDYYCYVKN